MLLTHNWLTKGQLHSCPQLRLRELSSTIPDNPLVTELVTLKPPALPWTLQVPLQQPQMAPGGPRRNGLLRTRSPPPPSLQTCRCQGAGAHQGFDQHVSISWNDFIFHLLNWISFRKGKAAYKSRFYGPLIRGSGISFEHVRLDVFQFLF